MMPPKTLEEDSGDGLSLASQYMSNDGSSSKSSCGASSNTDKTTNNSESQEPELARNETMLVRGSKALVFIVLLAATAGCGAATYLLTSQGEENNFHDQVSQTERVINISFL
jgi:hypothetical protein